MIRLEKVNKYFNRHKKNEIHVINNTSLTLDDKGLVSLLGPSGCGKTTLLNAIGGLDKVNKGNIYIDKVKLTRRNYNKIDKIRNLNIGYIFQDYNLVESLTVFDNVALSLKINGLKDKEEIKKRVFYVLEKVHMYKYRNRPVSMLSGGERQRVGIARAIVKNPKIIIADEPTGNLDSKNTIEIMNIIKNISKDRLVLLVTHEKDIADFYSDRILKIEDGTIIEDYKNEHNNELEYKMDSKIYLKDFKEQKEIKKDNIKINLYSNDKEDLDLNIVIQNGNIYIENKTLNKIELVNESGIELIDDHYKKINKDDYNNYKFDLNSISNKKYKVKYSSIFNPITLLIAGFKKVRDYSFSKKLLLIGFFISGLFIMYSISSLLGTRVIDESKFLMYNRNYLIINNEKNKIKDFYELEKDENVNYIIPSDSMIELGIKIDDYYQSRNEKVNFEGSLSSINMINKDDITYGRLPENNKEIILDEKTVYKILLGDGNQQLKSIGLYDYTDLLNRKVSADYDGIKFEYTIVGFVNLNSPCIYTYESEFYPLIKLAHSEYLSYRDTDIMIEESFDDDQINIFSYEYVKDNLKITKGRKPKKDNEIIVYKDLENTYPLNKKIDVKINGKKLKVVGYFKGSKYKNFYFANEETFKKYIILNYKNIIIYANNKDNLKLNFRDKFNIKDTYEFSKSQYLDDKKEETASIMITSLVFLGISLIEIYLMMRSSFLSRIKEVGIYRAIGVKKKDIYKMFKGEILVITTFSSLLGVLIMYYSLYELSFINRISDKFVVDIYSLLITIVFIYLFNLLVGLLPVYRTIKHTPAEILSRSDI